MSRERVSMLGSAEHDRKSSPGPAAIVANAVLLAAFATSVADARTHHRGSATGTTSGAPSGPPPGSGARSGASGDAQPNKSGDAALHGRSDGPKTSPTGHDVDHPHALETGGVTRETERHRERDGDHGRGDRDVPRGPTNVVAPTDVDRIDGVIFGNRDRSFKQRALIVWPKTAPFKSGASNATTAVGGSATGHGLHRHFVTGSAPHDGAGRNAIGMTSVGPTDERPRDHDRVDLPVGPAARPGAIGARIEPHRFEGLPPMIHPAAKVDAVISGTGASPIGGGVGHMVLAPAALGGPARNVAGIGGPPLARPRR